MKLKTLAGLMVGALAAVGLSQNVLANTMTFGGDYYGSYVETHSYSEDGINFTGSGNTFPFDGWILGDWEGTANLHTHGGAGTFDMGGAAFNLLGFDLNTNEAQWSVVSSSGASYTLPWESWGGSSTYIDLSSLAGFSGITAFSLVGGDWCLGVDNIALAQSAVPEPGTIVLLGTGLLGLVGFARRRNKAASSAA